MIFILFHEMPTHIFPVNSQNIIDKTTRHVNKSGCNACLSCVFSPLLSLYAWVFLNFTKWLLFFCLTFCLSPHFYFSELLWSLIWLTSLENCKHTNHKNATCTYYACLLPILVNRPNKFVYIVLHAHTYITNLTNMFI